MTAKERAAILRVLIDIVKADDVIDEGEMGLFANLKNKYGLTSVKAEAAEMTLADAVRLLKGADWKLDLLADIESLALADGTCAKSEALLLLALQYGLTDNNVELISINVPNLAFAADQVLYVESKLDVAVNKTLMDNYRLLTDEYGRAGLSFVFIPKVAEHYQSTPVDLFNEVCSFIAPGLDEEGLDALKNYIKGVSTEKFCTEQLYGKLGMDSLYYTNPGFLATISSSFVGGKLYHNFLKVEFSGNEGLVDQLRAFVGNYVRLQNGVSVLPTKSEDAVGKFMYCGYFKQLFDIYLLRNAERSTVLIDMDNEQLLLPEIDRKVDGPVHTKEKAFYLLVLFEMLSGDGLDFQKPQSVHDFDAYDRRLKAYQLRFNLLYRFMGGSVGMEPDISVTETRQQMKSRVNRYFKQISEALYQSADYMLQLSKKGSLVTHLEPSLVLVRCNGKQSSFQKSELFERLLSIE